MSQWTQQRFFNDLDKKLIDKPDVIYPSIHKSKKIHKKNKIIAKCSRTELAEMFMRPAPDKFLNKLLKN